MNTEMLMSLLQYGAVGVVASLLIMQFCNCFEQSSNYLGRNLGAGAKGSLIDAIASSLPELLVTLMFVASGKPELILAGVAVAAGSSLFNSCLIPALSIFAAKDEEGNKVSSFSLDRKLAIRNGVWLLSAEALLIWFLGFNAFTMLMSGTMLTLYVAYVLHVIVDSKRSGNDGVSEYEFETLESKGMVSALLNFDFNYLLRKDKELTTRAAWVLLLLAVTGIALACHFLAVSIEGVADAVGIPVYFSAVILGAAATSIPDTIMSVKSAQRGEYEDAVGNAVGSNVFDILVSLGLPLFLYSLVEGGAIPITSSEDLVMLRWFVLGITGAVATTLVIQSQKITKNTAWILLSLYSVWVGFIAYSI